MMLETTVVTMAVQKINAFKALSLLIIVQYLSLIEVAGACPSGFESIETYCYRTKGPEPFLDKFVNCTGNVFNYELSKGLELSDLESFWTDYTSVYPGSAQLLDWSYTDSMGTVLPIETVNGIENMSTNDTICVVKDDAGLTMAKCDEKRYRYCLLKDVTIHKQEEVNLTLMRDATNIKLKISYSRGGSNTLDTNKIVCFKDDKTYYPEIVRLNTRTSPYFIDPIANGYYWCTHFDLDNFYVSESNRLLYFKTLPEEQKYAVKFKYSDRYGLNDADIRTLLNNQWTNALKEYTHYTTVYSKTTNESNYTINDVINYKKEHPSDPTLFDSINLNRVVRVYVDRRTAIVHAELKPGQKPVKPGQWDTLEIEYMRPVYYCDKGDDFHVGMNRSVPGQPCVLAKCDGNYDEGVEEIFVPKDGCSDDPKKFEHDDIMTETEKILNSPEPITMKSADRILSRVDHFLNWKDVDISSHFLSMLEEISARVDLNGTFDSKTVGKNIALLVADASPSMPVFGLQVDDIAGGIFTRESFRILNNSDHSTRPNGEMVVFLPHSVSSIKRRVSFILFRNKNPFQEKYKNSEVNSQVLSVKVENLTNFAPGEVIDIHIKPTKKKQKRSQIRTCAFWLMNDDNTGSWSQEGCNFTRASQKDQLDLCQCNHLTHFAEILIPRTNFSKIHEDTLENLSVTGCFISILGLLFVGVTASLFSSWSKEFTNKIWLQLCISILILCLCFLVKVFIPFMEEDYLCPITGVMLHYSVLSSFCWMLVAAIISYRKLVAVLSVDPTHKLLRASVFAWGVPVAIVGTLLSIDLHSYDSQLEVKSPSGAFCYPSGLALWLAVYAPITLILLVNLSLFVLIVRSVFGKNRPNYHKQTDPKEAYRCATVSCVLVFLFGLPWILGLMSSNIICSYIFTILVTFQGFVLFYFFVCTKKTRDLWLVKLKIKKAKSPATTTTTELMQYKRN